MAGLPRPSVLSVAEKARSVTIQQVFLASHRITFLILAYYGTLPQCQTLLARLCRRSFMLAVRVFKAGQRPWVYDSLEFNLHSKISTEVEEDSDRVEIPMKPELYSLGEVYRHKRTTGNEVTLITESQATKIFNKTVKLTSVSEEALYFTKLPHYTAV